ncbi:hypothetical protein [Bdellovibrio sp. GT3]|uniref:hypothetical protein n=1 Tax=Bdellovibrio sp. GT3 TaxID=3136282 RepID=UPI0030F15982
MKKALCALSIIALTWTAGAKADVDSFIRQEVEMLAVKAALSADHPDRLMHLQNIQRASEYKKSLSPTTGIAKAETAAKTSQATNAVANEIGKVDSFIRQEVEMLAVKSALSADHPDRLVHIQNIQKASDYKKTLLAQAASGIISCQVVFK